MASYDEALQKMYSDRLTRFYRNYDEAKVASVPSRAEIKIDPWPARTHRSDARVDGVSALPYSATPTITGKSSRRGAAMA